MNETAIPDILIVDDEPLARLGVRELLRDQAGIGTIREAPNGSEAVRLMRERRPDLVFLDVQMPGIDGFGVIEELGLSGMPPVIFVTAYNEYAVKAFEVHAVDYLLKPIDPARFADALEHARETLVKEEGGQQRDALAALVPLLSRAMTAPPGGADSNRLYRIPVRQGGRIVLVPPAEIDWIEAQGNYVRLHRKAGPLRYRATVEEMAGRLGPDFVRIRRSILVRVAAIRYCEPLGRGSYVLVLHDSTRLTSSRYFRDQLDPLLGN